jgi:4-hydroxybenzoate polyprenyltransferase
MGLTGIAPVLGALSMWNIQTTSLFNLFILFIIGCLSHIFGFVLNDVIDVSIDRLSKELTARPLVSGSITRKKAAYFAISSMIIAFILSFLFYEDLQSYLYPFSVLLIAYVFATIYDFGSKRYPGMDFFVTGAVFFLILFGAYTVGTPTTLVWIVAFIGSIQVLFMNMINGAIKDIDHDRQGEANTLAIRLGARIEGKKLTLPVSFKLIGYLIEGLRCTLLFVPFLFLSLPYELWQIILLFILIALTYIMIFKLFSIKTFERKQIRILIGVIVIFMYATTPVMLYSLYPYIILLAFVPPVWFVFSNFVLHKTVLEPKTM